MKESKESTKTTEKAAVSPKAVTPPDLSALGTIVTDVVNRMESYDPTLTAQDIQAALNALNQMQVFQSGYS
jgi:hypothetical protein